MIKMIKKRYSVCVVMGLIWSLTVTGCGVQDAAFVFSVEETEVNDAAYTVADMDEAAERATIYVYVCGAVVNPGVVVLPEGSRADAALSAAGGFTENADVEYVNLAARLEDGQKLYFPTIEEAKAEQSNLVNINTADAALLMTLPGIGEARARDIISYREEYGLFQKKEDLKKVSGIKDNMYQKLETQITVQ